MHASPKIRGLTAGLCTIIPSNALILGWHQGQPVCKMSGPDILRTSWLNQVMKTTTTVFRFYLSAFSGGSQGWVASPNENFWEYLDHVFTGQMPFLSL